LIALLLTLDFISDIPLVLTAFFIWKFTKNTSIVRLNDIPLREMLAHIAAHPEEAEVKPKGAIRFISWLWD
jgi:amino acid transporter